MRKLVLTIAVLLLAGLSTRPVAAQSVTINGTTYQLPLQITINAAGSPTPTATSTATDTPTPTLTATGTPTLTPTPSATPTVGAAFVITNPTAGQTVSGIINVTVNTARTGSCADQTTVWWLGLQIDGVNAGADDKSIALDTTKYKNGSHRLTVNGWDCGVTGGASTSIIYSQSININVSNAAPTPTPSVTPSPLVTVTPTHFMTLPPNAALPSGQTCADLVHANPLPERIVANQAANAPPNSIPSYFYAWAGVGELNTADFAGVDGNFVGSTEDIFRWAACKWGIDEELVRDQAWQESFWRQAQLGDIDSPPGCNPGLPVTPITPGGQFCALLDLGGADAGFPDKGHQWDSWGVLQTKVYYAWHTWPMIKNPQDG